MTSATGRCRGFSILEILITLAIVVLFAGYFMLRFDDGRAEELLTRASTDLRSAALKAKKRSFAFRRDHYIVFARNAYWITDRPPPPDALVPDPGSSAERYAIPADVVVEFLVPGSKKWQKRPGYVWMFRDSGLSDPLGVRFSLGKSFTALNFNVLTGLAEEEMILE